jgi:hypothetical protein
LPYCRTIIFPPVLVLLLFDPVDGQIAVPPGKFLAFQIPVLGELEKEVESANIFVFSLALILNSPINIKLDKINKNDFFIKLF